MGAKTAITPEAYLHMAFDGPDQELVDGELLERNMGDAAHSEVQWILVCLFHEISKRHRLYGRPELRLRLSEGRFRIPDLAVFLEKPTERVPSTPPLIAIEILSPDDRYIDLLGKLREFSAWGVRHVWLVDPLSRNLSIFGGSSLIDVPVFEIPELGEKITAAEIFPA